MLDSFKVSDFITTHFKLEVKLEDEKEMQENIIELQMNTFENTQRAHSSLIQEKYHVTRLRTFAK